VPLAYANPQVGTLADGRVLQIHDRHSVATTDGTRPGEAVIGVLHTSGAFEVINASQVTSISVGVHPKVKQSSRIFLQTAIAASNESNSPIEYLSSLSI